MTQNVSHLVSRYCKGVNCGICREPATHKVSEEIFDDDPDPHRHPLTTYYGRRQRRDSGEDKVMSVRDAWQRIEAWLQENAPAILADLRLGASPEQIVRAEQRLGVAFPQQIVESYRIHDGAAGCALLDYWDFYSLDEAVQAWRSLKEVYDMGVYSESRSESEGPIRKESGWNPKWIPFAGEPGGDHLCFDLDPASEGSPGQVISWLHDHPLVEVLAPDLLTWLQQFATELELGKYIIDEEGILTKKNAE